MPERTRRTVKPSDIVGKWRYYSRLHSRIIIIYLRPNGEFVQSIPQPNDGSMVEHKGRWRVEGSYLALDDILIGLEEGDPVQTNVKWWIVESMMRGVPAALVIFGGDGLDERFWEGFVKLVEQDSTDEKE
ncbi:MAG TPA: hypothetical protein VM492_15385 [Sumerlaeia bacterium]|nr:hypothetical protein [Sumerlaeia bacterium]